MGGHGCCSRSPTCGGKPPGGHALFELRAVSVALVACAYVLLRQPRLLPYAPVIAWLVFAIGCALIAIAGIISTVAASATPILCVLFTFTAGALFPWGARLQLSAAAVAAAAIGLNLYWVQTRRTPHHQLPGRGRRDRCA